ncbi:L-asparaginase [Acrasis kona]|uniref:asparaginase n=1 Tax=Acrasis kona TaxID=1008807 RepID=A0AAW2ZC28_9EUKA
MTRQGQDVNKKQIHTTKILMIYTGGTIGMKTSPKGYIPAQNFLGNQLSKLSQFHHRKSAVKHYDTDKTVKAENTPVTFTKDSTKTHSVVTSGKHKSSNNHHSHQGAVPEWFFTPPTKNGVRAMFKILEYNPLMDSSNMAHSDWVKIATDIETNYELYDAFIVLHGTDTMAYTTSALSFMLDNLKKTVVVTGSQIPISQVRNDGFDNLLGSLTVAMHYDIPEVCLFFNNKLFRGNRCIKDSCSDLNAFDSMNFPPLVTMGTDTRVEWSLVRSRPNNSETLKLHPITDPHVGCLRIFPGITADVIKNFLLPPMKGVVLLTYGAGNAPDIRADFLKALKDASDRGVIIVNVTQCSKGMVTSDYAAGTALTEAGVISGSDMTCEAAITKLMYLLSRNMTTQEVKRHIGVNMRGELTVLTDHDRYTQNVSGDDSKLIKSVSQMLSHPGDGQHDWSQIKQCLFPNVVCMLASVGDLQEIKRLVEDEDMVLKGMVDYDHRSPLHLAACNGHLAVVKYLVQNECAVDAKDRWGNTALSEAQNNGHQDLIQYLNDTTERKKKVLQHYVSK